MEYQGGTSELTLTRYADSADQGGSRITTPPGRFEPDPTGEVGSSETPKDQIGCIALPPRSHTSATSPSMFFPFTSSIRVTDLELVRVAPPPPPLLICRAIAAAVHYCELMQLSVRMRVVV